MFVRYTTGSVSNGHQFPPSLADGKPGRGSQLLESLVPAYAIEPVASVACDLVVCAEVMSSTNHIDQVVCDVIIDQSH